MDTESFMIAVVFMLTQGDDALGECGVARTACRKCAADVGNGVLTMQGNIPEQGQPPSRWFGPKPYPSVNERCENVF